MVERRSPRRGRAAVREEERESAQYLTFSLGDDAFGVEIARVREILEYETPTEIPMVPPYIRGVINLRGTAVPVLDLTRRMGRGVGRVTRRTCIVIMEVGGREAEAPGVAVGVMVDGVREVLKIATADIEPRPALGGEIQAEFIHGMARRAGGFLVLLNVDFVFSGAETALFERIGDGMEVGREPVAEAAATPAATPATGPATRAAPVIDADFPIPVFGEVTP